MDEVHLRITHEMMIAYGSSSMVYGLDSVLKFNKTDDPGEHATECAVYSRIKRHPRIVTAYMTCQGENNIIILERMSMTLRDYLRSQTEPLDDVKILEWAQQILEGFVHLHDNNVLQSDIGGHNVLVDLSKTNLKLCDFAGSSLDGSEPLVYTSTRASHPSVDDTTLKTEHFAIGSLLYELSTGHEPHHDKSREEARVLWQNRESPEISKLVLAPILQKCWTEQYEVTKEILIDIQQLSNSHKQPDSEA